MDTQTLWTAALVVPALVLGVVGWRAARAGRTSLGLDPRHGALGEFGRGCAFSTPFFAALLLLFWGAGLVEIDGWRGVGAGVVGIWVYFLVLFLLEEVVFRGLFMTGLGVLAGRAVSLVVTAVLVALAYLFTDHSGALAIVGAVVTNLLTGLARWRSGRIWWGLGQRWVWNSLIVTVGLSDSAFSLDRPVLDLHLTGADWLTGGQFGVEGGLIGIAFLLVLIAGTLLLARGRRGPWQVSAGTVAGTGGGAGAGSGTVES